MPNVETNYISRTVLRNRRPNRTVLVLSSTLRTGIRIVQSGVRSSTAILSVRTLIINAHTCSILDGTTVSFLGTGLNTPYPIPHRSTVQPHYHHECRSLMLTVLSFRPRRNFCHFIVYFQMIELVLPGMLKRDKGIVVNIGSATVSTYVPSRIPYA